MTIHEKVQFFIKRDKFVEFIECSLIYAKVLLSRTINEVSMPDGSQFSHITPPDTGSALGKGFTVLSAILNAPHPPSLHDLAEATDLPRPTVFRVVRQLEDTMLITRSPDGDKYLVGPNLMALAADTMTSFVHAAPVRSILNSLVSEVGETCNVGVLDRDGVLYIDRVECAWPLRLQIGIGSRAPLHASAIGKLLMAHLPSRTRKRILTNGPLQRFTENTLTNAKSLEIQFKQIRRLGYACNDQENTAGLVGMAVPIYDTKGRVVAGLSVHAPAARMSVQAAIQKLDIFRDAARRIELVMRECHTPRDTTSRENDQ